MCIFQALFVYFAWFVLPFLSGAPVPQSEEWTLGAGVLFGAIAAGMFVKGMVLLLLIVWIK